MDVVKDLYALFLQADSVVTDSRNISPNCIFFALKGGNFDGNDFAIDAVAKGALCAVVDKPELKDKKACFWVPNVLKMLQQLAAYHRKKLGLPIIAITGSNGKTTTKELLFSVVSKSFKTVATRGNLNNHIGVPLTLLSMNKNTQIGIVEMGANHIEEIASLCEIAQPDYGMITNIGKAHLEGFGSFEGVIQAKTEMYKYLSDNNGIIFYNADNTILCNQLIKYPGAQKISYGKGFENFIQGKVSAKGTFIQLIIKTEGKEDVSIQTKLMGAYNYENVLAAVCFGSFLNIPMSQIKIAVENYYPENNRSQLSETASNKVLIDCYNANPTSMKSAIENFIFYEPENENKYFILGDMLELGSYSDEEHLGIVSFLHEQGIRNVFFVGPEFGKLKHRFDYHFFSDVEKLISFLDDKPIKGFFILLKGSRGIRLERVLNCL